MRNSTPLHILMATLVAVFLAAGLPLPARAHCDSLGGPVVEDARKALAAGDVTPVLKWVDGSQERELRNAFDAAMAVRVQGDDARELADRYFFETLVRIHRASEGEPFTGLKPATSIDPGLEAADEALASGSVKELTEQLSSSIGRGIQERFARVDELEEHAGDSVESGRDYVEAYVDYIHYVESVHRLATAGASHRHEDSVATAEQ